jgi:CRISPR-associated helicase cas3
MIQYDWDSIDQQLSDTAKIFPAKSGDATGYLRLHEHLSDAGAVAELLFDDYLGNQQRDFLRRALHLGNVDAMRRVVVFLAGVHDIGKATPSFVNKIHPQTAETAPAEQLRAAGLDPTPNDLESSMALVHSLASYEIVRQWLIQHEVKPRIANSIAEIVGAHHGFPVPSGALERTETLLDQYPEQWRAAHGEILDSIARVTGVLTVLPQIRRKIKAADLQVLTGFVILADWIASNQDAFPMVRTSPEPRRAKDGFSSTQLSQPWHPHPALDEDLADMFHMAFGWPAEQAPRPMQMIATQAAMAMSHAGLMLIEAPTGNGKTEAALMAAQVLGNTTGAQGAVIGTPTMATADGLFRRVENWADRQASGNDTFTMSLAHSKNFLNKDFGKLRLRDIDTAADTSSGPVSHIIASQWMSGARRALLATFVVGTVDQIFMLPLRTRYSMLRHLSLSGKVVIIDEVHAYSTYTNGYLHSTLTWLAWYGVPVILLSATLPHEQKIALLETYQRGLRVSRPDEIAISTQYPSVTVLDNDGVHEFAVPLSPDELQISVDLIDDDESGLIDLLAEQTRDGGCVLIITNTVDRAQSLFKAISEKFPDEVILVHSRFTAKERSAKERRLLGALGREATLENGRRPHRLFVIGTQVVEQSLDIDADLLVTDIAPMDLLMQRAGRLHRHEEHFLGRPEPLQEPRILIRGIWDVDTDSYARSEPPSFDPGAQAIYLEKPLLASSLILYRDVLPHGFQRPQSLSSLVQEAYDPDLTVPASWQERWRSAGNAWQEAQTCAERRSETFRLKDPVDYDHFDDMFARAQSESLRGDDGSAQVRDTDPSIEVIVILTTNDSYSPISAPETAIPFNRTPNHEETRELLKSSLRLPPKISRIADLMVENIHRLTECTPRVWSNVSHLATQVALCIDARTSTSSNLVDIAHRTIVFSYSEQLGLKEEKQ